MPLVVGDRKAEHHQVDLDAKRGAILCRCQGHHQQNETESAYHRAITSELLACVCLRAFSLTSSPTRRSERNNASQSSRRVAYIYSTVCGVLDGTTTFICTGC